MSRVSRQVIEVNRTIDIAPPAQGSSSAGPKRERAKPLRPRKMSDFPDIPHVYLDVARKLASPLLTGPPLCEELVAFVRHLLTEEEAGVMRHLGGFRPRSPAAIAAAEHRPLEQVEPILRRLAFEKHCIASSGPDHARRYLLMPVVPGIFEMVLYGVTPEAFTPWHRRFIELFEVLYASGYVADYGGPQPPSVRFLPLAAVKLSPTALPASQLEAVLEPFKVFVVGQCQCRMAMNTLGQGCGRPLGNCTAMGDWAAAGIRAGWGRQVSRQEVLAIKAEAEASGLVNWVLNVDSRSGQCSCSCCGCCCHAMRMISEFNAPGWLARPRFRPRFDDAACTFCGKCAQKCPMAALSVNTRGQTRTHVKARCIGCALCVLACPKNAVRMEPAPDYRAPFGNWSAYMRRSIPDRLRTAVSVWRKRSRELAAG